MDGQRVVRAVARGMGAAAGIAQTDLEAVGSFNSGQWAVRAVLFAGMAAVYALQAAIVYPGGAVRTA